MFWELFLELKFMYAGTGKVERVTWLEKLVNQLLPSRDIVVFICSFSSFEMMVVGWRM